MPVRKEQERHDKQERNCKMAKVKLQQLVILLVVAAVLLAACAAPTPTPAPKATEKPAAPPAAAPTTAPAAPAATKAPAPTTAPAAPTAAPAAKAAPVTFTMAHPGPIRTMDAPVTWYGSTHYLTNLLYDCLIWRAPDNKGYVGQAAEKWENVNPTTWRFYLRKGLTFHNGEPLDANAVKWNIDRVRTRTDFMVNPQWKFVQDVKVIDATTLEVTTPKPHAYFENDISYNGCQILPPKYLEQVGEKEFALKPVGSGPYKLVEMTLNERYVFEAWDKYWGGKPEVDRIVWQVIPEKASQMAALLAGQVDLIYEVSAANAEKMKTAKGVQLQKMTSNFLDDMYLRVETKTGKMAEKYPGYQPITLDKRIRQAISHALDRTLLADIDSPGYPSLTRTSRYYPEAHADRIGTLDAIKKWYDPELSKKLIKEAGFDPAAGKKPKLYMDASTAQKGVAETVAVMLKDVGFDVELNLLDPSAYSEQILGAGNNRDIMLTSLGGSPALTPTFYTCEWVQANYNVCVPEWDALSKEILTTVDQKKRVELWGKWQDFFLDYAHTIAIREVDRIYAVNDKFDFTPRADGWVTPRDLKLKK
jgi:peptide/nickel transport system substrate-binding protein